MKDVLTYKDFIGSVHFSSEDSVFFGRIEGINDLVTFEGVWQSLKAPFRMQLKITYTFAKRVLDRFTGHIEEAQNLLQNLFHNPHLYILLFHDSRSQWFLSYL